MVILIMNNIGNIYRLMENYDEAEVMIKGVVEKIEKQYGPEYPRLSTP